MTWPQGYDPLHSAFWSTLAAALPVVVLLGCLAWLKLRAHVAALLGAVAALLVAILVFGMPAGTAIAAALYGAGYGLFPIGWIVLNVIFLYELVRRRGLLTALQERIARLTGDKRLQLLLVAFSFGAFIEGAAGFGTPVAVTGGLLIALGFPAIEASGLALIANTAPVAFGALGTPIIALQGVTGLDLRALSAQVGHQLPVFSLIVPFWLVVAYSGWRGLREVWPAVLVAGAGSPFPQFLMATLHGPWLVDIVAAAVSMISLILFLRVWQPRPIDPSTSRIGSARRAMTPWALLTVLVFLWGLPQVKNLLNRLVRAKISGARASQPGGAHASHRRRAPAGAGHLHAQLALGDGHRDSHCGDPQRHRVALRPPGTWRHLDRDASPGAGFPAHHRPHDGDRIPDPIRRPRWNPGPRVCQNRRASIPSSAPCSDGSASR